MPRRSTPSSHRRPGLAAWLFFAVLACTVAAVLTCTALINGFIRDEARADATRYLQAHADALRDALDTGMAQHFEEVRVIGQLDPLAHGGDTAATRRMLEQVRASFPQFAWLGLTDAQGRVVASVDRLLEGQDVSARPWFTGARDAAYVGDVHRALLLEKLLPAQAEPWRFVDIATPVRGADGRPAGVLGAHLSWAWAAGIKRQIVDRALVQVQAEAFVLAANGTVLLGTPQTEGKPLPAGPPGDLHVVSLGAGAAGAAAPAGRYPGLGWQVVLRQPQAVAMAAFYKLQQRTLAAAALLCALAAPLLWWLARTLARPLLELTEHLDAEAAGAAAPCAPPPRHTLYREAQQLGDALDRHARRQADDAARWRELNAHLEARVAQRTEALEQANAGLQTAVDERQRSELRLRDITDNVPALIAYFDNEERCTFANAPARRVHRLAPADVAQTTLRSALGETRYAQCAEPIAMVKRGLRASFEGQQLIGTRQVDFRTHFVPDADAQGRLLGFYVLSHDQSALKAAERALAALAHTDSLTGLPNRRSFDQALGAALARCRRSGLAMAVLFLDIDKFKSINDRYGHAVGDQVLAHFAARLRGAVRETDTVARLAGDEFVIVLEGLHVRAEAQLVAGNILRAIEHPFTLAGAHALPVTTSIGIAFEADGRSPPARLLDEADQALYEAKRAGRNTFRTTQESAAAS